jgi:hypothetical protein
VACGSPALTQLDENYLPWPDTTRLRGFPGRGQRFVQRAALVVREVVTLGGMGRSDCATTSSPPPATSTPMSLSPKSLRSTLTSPVTAAPHRPSCGDFDGFSRARELIRRRFTH